MLAVKKKTVEYNLIHEYNKLQSIANIEALKIILFTNILYEKTKDLESLLISE